MASNDQLILKIDMIPIGSWGINLRSRLPRSKWDKLRKQVHERNGHRCEICGATEKLHCHEEWEFDEDNEIQKLVGLGTICSMCHFVTHIGRAKQVATNGYLKIEDVVSHFLKINKCDMETFLEHEKDAIEVFIQRSLRTWNVDYGEYAALIPE